MFIKDKGIESPLKAKSTKEKAFIQSKKETSMNGSSQDNAKQDKEQRDEEDDNGEGESEQTETEKLTKTKNGNKGAIQKPPVAIKPTVEKKMPQPSTKVTISNLKSKDKDKGFLLPHNLLLFQSKRTKDLFLIKFCNRNVVKEKCIDLNEYNSFKIPLYFHVHSQNKFVGLKVEYVHPRLIQLFLDNEKVDLRFLRSLTL